MIKKVYVVNQNMVGYMSDWVYYFGTKAEAIDCMVEQKRQWLDDWSAPSDGKSVKISGDARRTGQYYIERWPNDIGFHITLDEVDVNELLQGKTEAERERELEELLENNW